MATRNGQARRRAGVLLVGDREARAIAAAMGRDVRAARLRLRVTQEHLAGRIGISRQRVAEIERGLGTGVPTATWVALGIAIRRPLAIGFSRAIEPELTDAGHLACQEFVLGLVQPHGWGRAFELPTRPANPAYSIDVHLRINHVRLLVIVEIWNRLDDLGAAVRVTHRKEAEAAAIAAVAGGDGEPYRVATLWLLRDSAANRALVRRYPAILAAEFPGSSRRWVDALEHGTEPPGDRGIAWIDPNRGLSALNLPRRVRGRGATVR
jgi:DNA-binding XRE family transcriptional regulator